jgi:Fic family protein
MAVMSWPAITYETRPWTSRFSPDSVSRRQWERHAGPYGSAVPPDIAALAVDLPAEVLAAADDASQTVARFDVDMGGEIAPYGVVLLRSESAASSQIENLTASARAIAEAAIGDTSRHNAALIVANVRAMDAAIALADRIDADAIRAMHRALLADTEPEIAGEWRDQPVWIGGTTVGPHEAAFVPPHQSRIAGLITDLVEFAGRDDVPALAHAAVAHAQFETVHPFVDGNGRTGRALLHAMLRHRGLTRHVSVPISAGLLADTGAYFAALDSYRSGDLAPIVSRLADACLAGVANGRELVTELRDIRAGWAARVTARRDSAVWRLADLLIRQPVVTADHVAAQLGVAASNAYRYLAPLEQAGVLIEFTDRRRFRAWRAPEVLSALDAFATRAGRRQPGAGR